MSPSRLRRILLAVTGASGMPYALRLAEVLAATPEVELHVVVSAAGRKVLAVEAGVLGDPFAPLARAVYADDDIAAPPASGSWPVAAMVVCPCSMASLAAVAHGHADTLIHRAADVALKEGRRLVLVPRETPLSLIHLENMTAAARAGAILLPACPAFYHRPTDIGQLVDFVVARILDRLGLPQALTPPWTGA